ncbi:MAG: aminomethyl-transferring glycine dehydrogenase subunit GcvPA [Candidatus Latescibacterota bacterium]
MAYVSNTPAEQAQMLDTLGRQSMEELFSDIPVEQRAVSFDLPHGRSELEVRRYMKRLAEKNAVHLTSFVGAGFYDHFIPSAVDALASRSEFYTAYTPYQPEISQGTLQALYEYQSCICRLTGMEVSNASLYDGGTALYEATMMAMRITGRRRIVVDGGVNPIYRKMLACYTQNLSIELIQIPPSHGHSDREQLLRHADDRAAAVILQNPNFFGTVDDFGDVIETLHHVGSLAVVSVYPLSLGLLKTPGAMGADIVTGEGQSLGIPLSFGGPYLGFMATRKKHVRKMPGRIVGRTHDTEGRRGFVLTLQAREQHIRRDKATSNICTNQTHCALKALIYLSLLGKGGLAEVAQRCADKTAYARERLARIPGVRIERSAPVFNEFVVHLPVDAGDVVGSLIEKGFAAGFPLGRYYEGMEKSLLVAVTEKRTRGEIGRLAEALEDVLSTSQL